MIMVTTFSNTCTTVNSNLKERPYCIIKRYHSLERFKDAAPVKGLVLVLHIVSSVMYIL
jgi:hypothetical protein